MKGKKSSPVAYGAFSKYVILAPAPPEIDEKLTVTAPDVKVTMRSITFEQLCKDHIKQIKEKLGISGVLTQESSWFVQGDENEDGAQIDMIIDRDDRIINLCEIK